MTNLTVVSRVEVRFQVWNGLIAAPLPTAAYPLSVSVFCPPTPAGKVSP